MAAAAWANSTHANSHMVTGVGLDIISPCSDGGGVCSQHISQH